MNLDYGVCVCVLMCQFEWLIGMFCYGTRTSVRVLMCQFEWLIVMDWVRCQCACVNVSVWMIDCTVPVCVFMCQFEWLIVRFFFFFFQGESICQRT
jgi:hypothetical protein